MKNLWSEAEAEKTVARYAENGVPSDLALCVYGTRLLGAEPRLVLHGGGNTSCKTEIRDLVGETWDALCVKGSGWDMGAIEPEGLPAVKLKPLLKARALARLADEDMVTLQRANLIDPSSPNPSVETLLHAFLPHKFVDHTHATAVLSIVDQEDSQTLSAEAFGSKMGFVPYAMPGFALAKAAADVFDQDQSVEGLILDKHGIFTFGEDARQAYERMIRYVSMAEHYVATNGKPLARSSAVSSVLAKPQEIAPILRGAVAYDRGEGRFDRFVVDFRASDKISDFLALGDLERLARAGVSTPDLVIRIKPMALLVEAPTAGDIEGFGASVRRRVEEYVARYKDYFATNDARGTVRRTMLDPMPRLALVPGLGLFGFGRTLKDAKIASDVGEVWIEAATGAEAIGRFHPLGPGDLFDIEYWSLEQAKLAGARPKPLTGQVMLITGGAGAIGAATAKLFAANAAHVVVADIDGEKAGTTAKAAGNGSIGVACDVTDRTSVRNAFDAAVATFGGVDIVISNAGAAWEGAVGDLDEALLRRSFEINFFAHQAVAQNAIRIFKLQGTGGALLFNTSKQAVNPGANFGAYGLPKAATLFLSRQYALEYGKIGVRSNAVNADRIRSGILTDQMIASRSSARGLSEKEYMSGNLLGLEVKAEHVAEAFLHHALAERTTGDVTTVDGGNIAAALR
jgi:rhamnose utilization protein RhaD (predicted bifunctional aldolase and dehydrogenase)/NAD(P)-dependent dehydrogenase (short-subunit alcohol dehydrogenase family)